MADFTSRTDATDTHGMPARAHEMNNLKLQTIDIGGHDNILPPLQYSLSEHKTHIAIYWTLLVLTSGVWPIVLYFALRYGTQLSLYATFGICLAIPGIISFYSESKRTWRLWKQESGFRPIGQTSRWAFDAFQWNFIFAAVVITFMICIGCSILNYPLNSLPIAVLLLQLCAQLLLAELAVSQGWHAPFRISSTAKGQGIRPAVYTLVEDVIAVDGVAGTAFRERWDARYRASRELRAHLRLMDLIWGVSGVVVAIIIFVVVFSPVSPDAGYAVGWALPWIWAGFMTWLTVSMTKSMLRRERQAYSDGMKSSI